MCPRHVGGRYPTPGSEERAFQTLSCLALHADHLAQRVYHVHQIALRFHHCIDGLVCHRCFVDDVRVLTALDAGGRLAWSSKVKRRFASVRDMARPAPWLQLMKLSGLPLPRPMYERAPMLPGIIPMSPSRARTAPFRVMSTFSP